MLPPRHYQKRDAIEPECLNSALQTIDQQSNKLSKLVGQLLDLRFLKALAVVGLVPRGSVFEQVDPIGHAHLALGVIVWWRVGLDVDYRRAIDHVQSSDIECCALDSQQRYRGQPDRVGTLWSAAGEHAHFRHVRGSLRSRYGFCHGLLVHPIQHDDVRVRFQSVKVVSEFRSQVDAAFHILKSASLLALQSRASLANRMHAN